MNEEEARKILKRIDIKFFLCGMNEQSNYIVDEANKVNNAIETVLNLLEKKDTLIHTMQSEFERLEDLEDNTDMLKMELEKKDIDIIEAKEANRQLSIELQKKDKIIDEIQKEVRDHIGFENRLKRDNKEPDLFNQGRFYVANNINNILKGK